MGIRIITGTRIAQGWAVQSMDPLAQQVGIVSGTWRRPEQLKVFSCTEEMRTSQRSLAQVAMCAETSTTEIEIPSDSRDLFLYQ